MASPETAAAASCVWYFVIDRLLNNKWNRLVIWTQDWMRFIQCSEPDSNVKSAGPAFVILRQRHSDNPMHGYRDPYRTKKCSIQCCSKQQQVSYHTVYVTSSNRRSQRPGSCKAHQILRNFNKSSTFFKGDWENKLINKRWFHFKTQQSDWPNCRTSQKLSLRQRLQFFWSRKCPPPKLLPYTSSNCV